VVNYCSKHLLSYFRDRFGLKPGAFPMAERIGDATISVPFYPNIPAAHIEAVADGLKAILSDTR